MRKNFFHSKKKEAHPTANEHCSLLREDCIKQKCLFWVREFEKTCSLNQKEAFAAAFAMSELRNIHGSLLEPIQSSRADVLKRFMIAIDPVDGRLFFESLLQEERLTLTLSIAETNFKGQGEKIYALANIYQMAAFLQTGSLKEFMDSIRQKDIELYFLFQGMAWWSFEDLQFLDEKNTKRWLKECAEKEIRMALKRSSKNFKEVIFSCMEQSDVEKIKAYNQRREQPSAREIKKARDRILKLIINLAEKGEVEAPLESYRNMLEEQKARISQNKKIAQSKPFVGVDQVKNANTNAVCPIINSGCMEDKCLFWEKIPGSSDVDKTGCLICFFIGLLYAEGDTDLQGRQGKIILKAIPGLLVFSNRAEITMAFSAFIEDIQVETIFWMLSTACHEYLESDPDKKQFFSTIVEELKKQKEFPTQSEQELASQWNVKFDPLEDRIKPFLHSVVSDIIQGLPFKRRDSILGKIRLRDADIYKDMELYGWHSFDDLAGLSDKATQCWLKEANSEDLLLAMKLCGDKVKDKIFNNMSERAAAMIAEDLRSMGPVRMSDVEKSQRAILKVVRAFMAEKKIKGWK